MEIRIEHGAGADMTAAMTQPVQDTSGAYKRDMETALWTETHNMADVSRTETRYMGTEPHNVPENKTTVTDAAHGGNTGEAALKSSGAGDAFDTPAAECELSPQAKLAMENRKTFTATTDTYARLKNTSGAGGSKIKVPKNYDATGDLMAIASAEKQEFLKVIHIRLLYKLQALGITSNDETGEAEVSKRKIKRVISRVKAKLKGLRREEQMAKKAKLAEKNRKHRLEVELKRELAMHKRNRKAKEKADIDDSKHGMGCNYDGRLPEDASIDMRQIEAEIASLNMQVAAAAADARAAETSGGSSGSAAAADGAGAAAVSADVGSATGGFSAIC